MKSLRIARRQNFFSIACFAALLFFGCPLRAQNTPSIKIDETVTRFAYSGDGRIAYSVRHVFSENKIELQRDDVWIMERDGRKRRILQGDRFMHGAMPFSYTVRGMRWSPGGTKLSIELATSEMINDAGETREGVATMLLDDTGEQIQAGSGDCVLPGATEGAWLDEGATLSYFVEAQNPNAVPPPRPPKGEPRQPIPPLDRSFALMRMKVASGVSDALFPGRVFSAIAWNSKRDMAIAIERSPGTKLHPRLVQIDPANKATRDLATLDGYAGGLTISPSGKEAAYWVDNEKLEVREVNEPNRVARVRIEVGTLAWSGDGKRVLVKRGPAALSGDLAWVALPPTEIHVEGTVPPISEPVPQAVLHDLEFRQFEISPDGKFLAVVEPGKRNLLVYATP
jgi:hypothetical protein